MPCCRGKKFSQIITSVMIVLASILIGLKRDDGYDFFWYLGAGNLMHGNSSIGQPFTAEGLPWHNHEWLFHWILSLSPQPSLFHLVLKLILVLAIIVSLFMLLLKCTKGKFHLSALVAVLAGLLSSEYFALRAQLGSYLFFIITLAIILSKSTNIRKAVYLAPLMIIWANIHGAFVLGIFLVIYCQLFEVISSKIRKTEYPSDFWVPIVAVLLFPLINANGLSVYTYPMKWLGNEIYKEHIREWTSVTKWSSLYHPYLITLAVSIILLAGNKTIKFKEFLLFIFFAALPFSAVRHLPFFYMFTAIVFCDAVASIDNRIELKYKGTVLRGNWKWVSVILILILSMAYSINLKPVMRITDPIYQKYAYPTGAIAFMNDNKLDGRMLNAYQWGGFLWLNGFDIFIDGRLDTLYPESVFREFNDVVTARQNRAEILDKWDVRFVLFDTILKKQTPKLILALSEDEDWMILYQDPVATLFARKKYLDPDFISRFQSGRIPVPDEPMCQYAAGMTIYRHDGSHDEVKRYLNRAIELDPAFAQPHLSLGRVLINERKYPEALKEIKKAQRMGLRGDEITILREITVRNR